MLKNFLLTALVVLSSFVATAQISKDAPSIAGHVVDATTGDHLPFVVITVDDTNYGTTTDDSGHYHLGTIPSAGTYNLTVNYTGYKSVTKAIKVEMGKTYILNFEVEEDALAASEVVVTANRYAIEKRKAGTIVNVLSPKMFENTASVTAAEALDFQPGLRMEYNCNNCGLPQLRVNGLEGHYSQILLDSRAIFSSLSTVYGMEQLPASMIERIEVIRGGGSTLYGSNAIAGIVNIITKEPSRSSFEVSNQSMIMGSNATDISTSINGSIVSSDLRTGLSIFGQVRDRQYVDLNDDGYSEIPELKSESIGFRGYQKLGEHSKLTAEYHHLTEFRRGGNDFDLQPHEADIAEQIRHRTNGGSLDWVHTKDNNVVSIYGAAQGISRESYYGAGEDPDAYGSTTDLTMNTGVQWIHSFNQEVALPATLTVGSEFNYNLLNDQMPGYDRYLDQMTNNIGVFAQNEWQNDAWSILAGARIDKHNLMSAPVVSPRATVRFAPIEALAIRAGYARGFRAPQAFDEDLHISAVGGEVSYIVIDPDLKPEYSNTVNLSLDFYKQTSTWQYNLLAEGFYTKLSNVFALQQIGTDDQGNILYNRYNASGATVAGVNLEARISYMQKLDIQAGFTFQSSRYEEAEQWSDDVEATTEMFRSPDNYGYMTVDYRPLSWLGLNASAVYTGSMLVQHEAGYIETDCNEVTPSFWDLGFKLNFKIPTTSALGVELNVGIKNILDQRQDDLDVGADRAAGYFYGPLLPRSYFVGAKFFF
ncbi:MAG: TonB-dependent receptor [Rikenellaceae bacterium]